MKDEWAQRNFQTVRHEFDVLCKELELGDVRVQEGLRASAASGHVRLYLENDRGLCEFAVGASGDSRPLCALEDLAQRFPRVRLLPDGRQRLTLEEQCAFIRRHWADLQTMFSPEHLKETRTWQRAAAAALTKKYSQKG